MRGTRSSVVRGVVLAALVAGGAAHAQEVKPPKISGFGQVLGYWDQSNLTGKTAGADRTNKSFALRRIRLAATGDVGGKGKYNIMLAGESGTSALLNGFVDYAFLDNNALTGRMGQFKYPFALEGLESGPRRPMIVYAEATDTIAKKLGTRGASFRDVGVQLSGQFRPTYTSLATVDWAFAVLNGSGTASNGVKDNNNDKDYVARVQVNLPPYVLVGASGHAGQGANQGAAFQEQERSFGFHAQADLPDKKGMLRAEYLSGFYRNARGLGRDTNPLGWYVLASYRAFKDTDVLARYEDWQANRLVTQGRLRTTTLGASYYVTKNLKVMLNHLIRRGQINAAVPGDGTTKATGSAIRDLTITQVQFEF